MAKLVGPSGPALLGMQLAAAVLLKLRQKGLLTTEEAEEIIDTALLDLERHQAAVPATKKDVDLAHELLDSLLAELRRT